MSIKIKLNNDWVDTNIKAVRGVNHVNSEDVYTKEEADNKFATKESTDTKVAKTDIVQSVGNATDKIMSQKAVSDIVNELEGKVNAADEEDITIIEENGKQKLKFADRNYEPLNASGKGYKILRKNIIEIEDANSNKVKKNILTKEMVSEPNTIYEIRYDYDLNGTKITIPKNCTLKFEGGSLKNGSLVGNNTAINADIVKIFDNIIFKGKYNVNEIYPQWWGALANDTLDCTQAFQDAINSNISKKINIPSGTYRFDGSLKLQGSGFNIRCSDLSKTTLKYYGNENFVIIGNYKDGRLTQFSESTVEGGYWTSANGEAKDIFHFIYGYKLKFDSVITDRGEFGYNCSHSEFKGFYYGCFFNCVSQWHTKDGFCLYTTGTGQVNNIQLYNCKGSGCGKPYADHDYDIIDETYGNGISVSGTSISIISCSCEANAGCGIKILKDVQGLFTTSSYFEQNLYYNVYVDGDGYKKNICILPHYASFGEKSPVERNVYIGYSSSMCHLRNIIDNTTNTLPLQILKDFTALRNIKLKLLKDEVKKSKMPTIIDYKILGNLTNNIVLCLGINIEGTPYVLYKAVETFKIKSIEGDIVTLDKAVSTNTTKLLLISESSAAYRYRKELLYKYPMAIHNTFDNTVDTIYNTNITQGKNSFTLTELMKKGHPYLKVGDIVYSVDGYYNLHTITNNTKEKSVFLYNNLYNSAPKEISDNLCLILLTNGNSEDLVVDKMICSHFNIQTAMDLNMILNPKEIAPTITIGAEGQITNLENNTYFNKLYASSNYTKEGLIKCEDGVFTINTPDSGYGLGLCVDCSNINNIVALYKSSSTCGVSYAFFDSEYNYIKLSIEMNPLVPENAKFVVAVIWPVNLNTDVIIKNIAITSI